MSHQFSKDVSMGVSGSHGNIVPAVLAGLIAAIIGAAIWMGITVATGFHVGYVALGVGALVGYAVRVGGNGTTMIYGIVGAIFTFLGCLAGEVLSVLEKSTSAQQGLFDLVRTTDLVALISNIFAHTDPIMYLIYAIGIFEGYKFSIRS
jgi:hypothetical protein